MLRDLRASALNPIFDFLQVRQKRIDKAGSENSFETAFVRMHP
jgi:hypothetical protein